MNSEIQHTVISANGLSIGYFRRKEQLPVIEGINFSLRQGTLVSLVGANGVGKSTLLRTLSGMQKQLDGNISIEGKSLKDYTPNELATVLSVVLTEAPVSKNLTVTEFISLGRQPHTNWMGNFTSHDKQVVMQAMEQTETTELKDRRCFELSDGQMQRVSIARALAQDTPLVILDEPTTHLDLYHRAYVLKLLRKLTKDHRKTVLYSTHEIDLALQMSDEMLLIADSQLYHDTPKQLISEGKVNLLFPENTVSFDPESGRFTIEN